MDVLNQYIEISRCLRSMLNKFYDLSYDIEHRDDTYTIFKYIKEDIKYLRRLWPIPDSSYLDKLVTFFNKKRVDDIELKGLWGIIDELIPNLTNELDELFLSLGTRTESYGLEGLLHPIIIKSSYRQYREGHYRDAVFNAVVSVFDFIRERTNLQEDGDQLIGKAFSIENPVLVLSTLDTDSGLNEQKGFMQILKGTYQGIRNPKAHSLATDLKQDATAQYLVFASLLARRLDEAKLIKTSSID